MTELICTYAGIWAPAITAVLGIIIAVAKITSTLNELKADNTLKEVKAQLAAQNKENSELVRTNKLLLDELKHIKNYADSVKEKK